MKRMKMIIIVCVLIILVIGIFILVKSNQVVYKEEGKVKPISQQDMDEVIQVVARVDSEEEAEEIAKLYGITYLRYRDGYGEYETTEDYETLKEIGLENNYPDLEIIYKSYTK